MINIPAEKLFENQVKRWLNSVGVYPLGTPMQKKSMPAIGYWVKRWGGGLYTKSGLPDMQIVIHGKCIEVELKAKHGKPSEVQKHIIKEINDSGGMGIILYPDDFEEFKNQIRGLIDDER